MHDTHQRRAATAGAADPSIARLATRIALVLATVAVAAGLHPTAGRAVQAGDCDGKNGVSIGEVQKCANIFSGRDRCTCPACDRDGKGTVSIGEVQVAANCFSMPAGCPEATPGAPCITPSAPTPTATATPPAADTEVPTPAETATSVPPSTATASPTGTKTPSFSPTAAATSTRTATSPPAPTATSAASPTPTGTPLCGNNLTEPGETCDDGNTITNPPADSCPADCTIITCTPAGTNQVVSVSFTPPAGKNIGTLGVLLEYPDGTIQIPGTGDDDLVLAAVTNTPSGFLASSFDYDYALQVGLAGNHALTVGQVFRVTFANCQGAAPPTAAQLKCTVTLAKDTTFKKVDGVTCTATVL